jgi:hypothetical protein
LLSVLEEVSHETLALISDELLAVVLRLEIPLLPLTVLDTELAHHETSAQNVVWLGGSLVAL